MTTQRRVAGTIAAAGMLVAGLAGPAMAITATVENDAGQVAAKAVTHNSNMQVALTDTLSDGRWVLARWTEEGHGPTVFHVENRSGVGNTVLHNTNDEVTSLMACFSGTFIHPMECGDWH